jgi:hypothetical protein
MVLVSVRMYLRISKLQDNLVNDFAVSFAANRPVVAVASRACVILPAPCNLEP